ncbi:MAG TPA: 16S rRNA (guanine(527)-N(7))-methyltransferase RsmG [Terriglobales bacterium]|nr:16S rRNA (guanine(527)-N(7))-methyltransferase RsmG [Terriglobales bacterium]
MDFLRIAELLQPFLDPDSKSSAAGGGPTVLFPAQLQSISTYIDLLMHWNARVNLTSVRRAEQIVTRHFGESLFTARHLFPAREQSPAVQVIDVGSGAGFPGLPIRIWAPHTHLTLIESNHKKATFLREVIRALTLINVNVFAGRAAAFQLGSPASQQSLSSQAAGDVVTLRAVEHFDSIVPAAASLVSPSGRMAILIGHAQINHAHQLTPDMTWDIPIRLPLSSDRALIIGRKGRMEESNLDS